LCAILNSRKIDTLIKPFQAKGAFGERHVNKIPLLFPIPKYDPNIQSHKELAKDGITCSKVQFHQLLNLFRSDGLFADAADSSLSRALQV
jgi:hypothetical protein